MFRRLGPLVRLALPIVLVQLSLQAMSLVGTILAGRLGTLALGATGLGGTIFFCCALLGIGVTMGVDPLASQAFGAGRARAARRAMWQGVYAAAIITLPITAITLAVVFCLEIFGVSRELAVETRAYVFGRLPSLLPLLVFAALRAYLQAAHVTRPILVSAIVANVFNFGAIWELMYGEPRIGLPSLGIFGIGLGSTLATIFQTVWLAVSVRRIDPGSGDEPLRGIHPATLRRVFSVGTPIGLQILAEAGIFSLVGVLAGTLGTQAMASHQVAIMLASFTFMVPLGIGAATSVQVGRAVGRGDVEETHHAGLMGIGLGGGFMTVTALVMWAIPTTLARIMSSDPEVIAAGAIIIRVAAAFQIFDGIQAVASGALRGTGSTRWAMAANLVAYWLVALPVAFVLGFGKRLGVYGLWWGLTAGLAVAAVVLTTKFLRISRRPIAALQVESIGSPQSSVQSPQSVRDGLGID